MLGAATHRGVVSPARTVVVTDCYTDTKNVAQIRRIADLDGSFRVRYSRFDFRGFFATPERSMMRGAAVGIIFAGVCSE